jgi:hypothetical protein
VQSIAIPANANPMIFVSAGAVTGIGSLPFTSITHFSPSRHLDLLKSETSMSR